MTTWKTWISTYILICYVACVWIVLAYVPESSKMPVMIGISLLYIVLVWLGLQPDPKVAKE